MTHQVYVALVTPPGPIGKIKECIQFTISGDDFEPPTWVAASNLLGPQGIFKTERLGVFDTLGSAQSACQAAARAWYLAHEESLKHPS
jgi:hypothetical protein